MHVFFATLATVTTLLFGAAFFFGAAIPDRLYHFYFGLIGTVSALLTHCWVFFYFIGTGQGIRDAVIEHKLDVGHLRAVKKFKGRAFPFALFAMIFAIVGATVGGALRAGKASSAAHVGWTLFAVAFNLFAFRREYRVIQENRALTQNLETEIARKGN